MSPDTETAARWLFIVIQWGGLAFVTAFTSVLLGCCVSSTVRTACVVNGLSLLLWQAERGSAGRSIRSRIERTTDGAPSTHASGAARCKSAAGRAPIEQALALRWRHTMQRHSVRSVAAHPCPWDACESHGSRKKPQLDAPYRVHPHLAAAAASYSGGEGVACDHAGLASAHCTGAHCLRPPAAPGLLDLDNAGHCSGR